MNIKRQLNNLSPHNWLSKFLLLKLLSQSWIHLEWVASTTCSDKYPRGIFLTKMNSLTWAKIIWHLFGIVMLKFCFKCIHFFSKISIFSSKFSLYVNPKQVSTIVSKDSSVSLYLTFNIGIPALTARVPRKETQQNSFC